MDSIIVANLILIEALVLVIIISGMIVYVVISQKRVIALEKDKISREKDLESTLSIAIVKSQEQERKNIGEELHEDISPILSIALMSITNYSERNTVVDWNISNAIENLELGISKIRNVSHLLHPASIENLGFIHALKDFCQMMNNSKSVNIQVQTSLNQLKVEPFRQLALYRIVQELMINAIKHSNAKNITIAISENQETYFLSIFHDGSEFKTQNYLNGTKKPDSLGLKIVQHRLILLNGKIFFNPNSENVKHSIEIQCPIN